MADEQGRELSDDTLLQLFNSDEDLSILTPGERTRMLRLTDPKPKEKAAPVEPKSTKDTIADSLSTIGGTIGGIAGGSKASPIGMAAAAAGGAAGEGYSQLLKHGAEIPGAITDVVRNAFLHPRAVFGGALEGATEGATRALKEGGKQALYEGGGRLIGAGARQVAKPIYAAALWPSQAAARNIGGGNVARGYNRIVSQGIDDAVLPSGLGLGRATKLVEESRNAAGQLAAQSNRAIPIQRILNEASTDQATRMGAELRAAGVAPRPQAVAQQLQRVQRANPSHVSMSQVHALRRGQEDIAEPIFAAARMPGGAGRVPLGTEASVAHSLAGASKGVLDKYLGPAFVKQNATTMARRGVRDAINQGTARGSTIQNAVAGGAGVLGGLQSGDPADAFTTYALLRALGSPTAGGALAMLLAKTPYAALLRGSDYAGLSDFEHDVPDKLLGR